MDPKTNLEAIESQLKATYDKAFQLEQAKDRALRVLAVEQERWGGLLPGQARVVGRLICVLSADGKRTIYQQT